MINELFRRPRPDDVRPGNPPEEDGGGGRAVPEAREIAQHFINAMPAVSPTVAAAWSVVSGICCRTSPFPGSEGAQPFDALSHRRTWKCDLRLPLMQSRTLGWSFVRQSALSDVSAQLTQQWLQKQTDRLLPVHYFLVTCTVPQEVRDVIRSYREEGFNAHL
ncbi:MAG: hypothetical protein R3C17_16050 [Planctomycetaceae bacterium]